MAIAQQNTRTAQKEQHPAVVIGVLVTISTFAWIDRSVIPLLVDPIKADLHLSDVQVSLVMGLAFSVAYAVANIPAGIVADRLSRRGILGVACAIWSVLLMSCGFATTYWRLLATRVGVGVVESFVAPASFSLIGERVPRGRHGTAFAVMGMGPFLGGALALAGGGALLAAAERGVFATVPLLGAMAPWQIVFVASGLITLPLSLLALLLRPDSREARQTVAEDGHLGLDSVFTLLREKLAVYVLLIAFATCSALLIFGVSSWIPAMMARKFGIPLSEVGYIFGMQGLIFGAGGLVLGGAFLDAMIRRKINILLVAAVLIVVLTGLYVVMPLVEDATLAWVLVALGAIVTGPLYPIGSTVLARVTPPAVLGKMSVIYSLPQGVIGAAVGPTLVAIFAAELFTGPAAIAPAMSLFAAIAGAAALILVLALARRLHDL